MYVSIQVCIYIYRERERERERRVIGGGGRIGLDIGDTGSGGLSELC
jgi:hypothetical protein